MRIHGDIPAKGELRNAERTFRDFDCCMTGSAVFSRFWGLSVTVGPNLASMESIAVIVALI
jgi:hypothetical protein